MQTTTHARRVAVLDRRLPQDAAGGGGLQRILARVEWMAEHIGETHIELKEFEFEFLSGGVADRDDGGVLFGFLIVDHVEARRGRTGGPFHQ